MRALLALSLAFVLAACSGSSPEIVKVPDAGSAPDAGEAPDAGGGGNSIDAGTAAPDAGTPDHEALCTSTSGTWVPGSCGDYSCGRPPACNAVIPGCDCGPTRVFDPEKGCVASDSCLAGYGETCGGHTQYPRSCGPGLICAAPGGAYDAPGTCQPDPTYSCDDGAPCGRGLACCYPCGIPGCKNSCVVPKDDGSCPEVP